jgi:hypothetical protein
MLYCGRLRGGGIRAIPCGMEERYTPLAGLLRERLAVIADHAWRDRDAAGHLDRLRTVSEAIMAQHEALRPGLPPRLAHYLERCSYDKALAFLEGREVEGPH